MIAQGYEFIRQQLIIATADLYGSTKGQLQALLEDAQFDTKNFRRKKLKVFDEESGRWVTRDNPPISAKQSRAKCTHIPLVLPVEYVTASWRRALLALEPQESAWLLWCYADDTSYAHQAEIVRWGWNEFSAFLTGKRVAHKTLARLRALVWLAAQDVHHELRGKTDRYQHKKLAELAGVSKTNWSENYAYHWDEMRGVFQRLDKSALLNVSRTRSQQKEVFSTPGIAKMN